MKPRSQWWQVLVGLACSILLFTACGGGGGGGNDGPSIPSTYTGLTTQAILTENNVVEIVKGAIEGGMLAEDVGGVVPLGTPSSAQGDIPTLLRNLAVEISAREQGGIQPLAIIPVTGTIPADCSDGSADYTISIDDTNGTFTGTITFTNYCSMDVTFDGVVPISGKGTDTSFTMKLVFDDPGLSVSTGTLFQTLTSGSASFALYETYDKETLNYVLIDNTSLQTFFISNYVLTVTYGTPDTATLTGRYYHPDYGYVGISTLTKLTVPDTALPTGGTVRFSGSGSRADLTFNADQSTLLQLDTNNDGTYEFSFDNPL